MTKFYLTTAIPYVNGKPHIGHALEYFQSDTIRSFHQLKGEETLLLSGADENALKNIQTAEKEGVEVQEFLDRNSKVFEEAFGKLGVKLDVFQRSTSQEKHWPGVQKLWQLCQQSGDIYKKAYEGLYCVGCESFKTEGELTPDGLCPDHLKKPELVKEENYFFRLSKYQDQLIQLIESGQLLIIPENKKAEALSFIKQGLEDFSISRSNARARGIGVPVPGDESQKIYVWFDALNVYMTGVGFGYDEQSWQKWWPADLHIIGKDINRFHTVYWPAMLLSAGLPLPKAILIHGFINAPGGQKMSKSLGNVIDPFEMVEQFGLEPFRYYLLSQIPTDNDGEISLERFKEVYTANLANGLGNLVARLSKLIEIHKPLAASDKSLELPKEFSPYIEKAFIKYDFNEALNAIWIHISNIDKLLNEWQPWKKTGIESAIEWIELIKGIRQIGYDLQPFLPETAKKILDQFQGEIKATSPLFPRLS